MEQCIPSVYHYLLMLCILLRAMFNSFTITTQRGCWYTRSIIRAQLHGMMCCLCNLQELQRWSCWSEGGRPSAWTSALSLQSPASTPRTASGIRSLACHSTTASSSVSSQQGTTFICQVLSLHCWPSVWIQHQSSQQTLAFVGLLKDALFSSRQLFFLIQKKIIDFHVKWRN